MEIPYLSPPNHLNLPSILNYYLQLLLPLPLVVVDVRAQLELVIVNEDQTVLPLPLLLQSSNIDDHTQSDDSIEIHPSRAIRFQRRSQALKKGAHSVTIVVLTTGIAPVMMIQRSKFNRKIIGTNPRLLNLSLPHKREVKEIDTTKKTKSKVTDTKTKSKVTDTQKTKILNPPKKYDFYQETSQEIDTSFPKIREKLAQDLLIELNTKVFRINYIFDRTYMDPNTGAKGYKIKVELALKVVDNLYKLRTTLAHELCHVACARLSDHQLKENHGRFFKAWGHRVHSVMKDITITTKHNYDIDYKFKWMCCKDDCDRQFGRHSDSIKPARQRCICGEGEGDQHPSNANVYLSDLEDLDPSDFKICTEIPNLIDLDPAPPPPPPPHILDGPAYDVIPIDKVDLLNQFDALRLSISSSSD
ncbi:hypothetical protein Pst134EA_009886 [Puccinia striiformis f. sp. tritici]|uniref:hypothetical protein n=1 Tax=Puccinia striiformis f. sp. tritici TaxID=168172 RepID=UPI00200813CF|nr:hypothetical protein Pst134EA_009886 [Puccinia striiformis f. sp. tritici]KAH9469365.1 hypothetical protein Pst134EA_009886 [Puccinia striiformis f. sp. tritici]